MKLKKSKEVMTHDIHYHETKIPEKKTQIYQNNDALIRSFNAGFY